MTNKWSIIILSISFIFFNCKKTTKSDVGWGSADFSTFVTIGNSLTAGVSDGALFEEAQENSFPNLIAKAVEIADFEQPFMSGNGFSFNEDQGRLSLNLLAETPSIVFLQAGSEKNRNLNRPYNNLGIPLIRANQAYNATVPADAADNHFIDKILRNSGNTQIEEALSLSPTLMTLWIGNNDVLEAASLGLADPNFPYTDPNDFETHFTNIVNELTAGSNAPILVANIFEITDLPYFTSLPSSVQFGGNDIYLFGDCEDGVRELTDDDIVLFWAIPDYLTFLTSGNITPATALNDTLILDAEEKTEIINIINEYNDIIESVVAANNQLYLVDLYALFKNIATNGYEIDGETYTNKLIYFDSNGLLNLNLLYSLFSYDGLHPNQYGYISIANAFIQKINATFGADIPVYD
jgi:lysophospholipase L1-like esterase